MNISFKRQRKAHFLKKVLKSKEDDVRFLISLI